MLNPPATAEDNIERHSKARTGVCGAGYKQVIPGVQPSPKTKYLPGVPNVWDGRSLAKQDLVCKIRTHCSPLFPRTIPAGSSWFLLSLDAVPVCQFFF